MEHLTKAGVFDLALVFGYTLGAFLVVSSLLSMRGTVRISGIALVRMLGGLALIVPLLVVNSTETFNIFPVKQLNDTWSLITIGVAVIVAVAIGELAVYRIAGIIDAILVRIGGAISDHWLISKIMTYGGTVTVVAISVAVLAVALPEIKQRAVPSPPPTLRQTLGFELILEATYSLPGSPLGLVFRGDSDGYITLAQGEILHFELPEEPGGDLPSLIVASNLDSPRGLAIADDILYVVDLGPLPCPSIYCSGRDIEAQILEESNGSIFAFDVFADGTLGNKRTILTGLPAANYMHGPNGLEIGPDGLLYLSIGGIDSLFNAPDVLNEIDVPNLNLLGTIIRFNPDGSGLEIFAEGLRNVYGLTFDDRGLLYGVDNDGQTLGGWRREEVLQIKQGANYGYPQEGSFGPHQIRDDEPIWFIDGIGAAGISWAERIGLGPGSLIGTTNQLHYLELTD